MKMKYVIILILLFFIQNFAFAQVKEERKQIIGVWMEEHKNQQFEFKTNGECIEYLPSNKSYNKYTYKISDTIPVCIPKGSIEPGEKATFLEMVNKKTGLKLCYEINGFTPKTLSLSPLGRVGVQFFNRMKK